MRNRNVSDVHRETKAGAPSERCEAGANCVWRVADDKLQQARTETRWCSAHNHHGRAVAFQVYVRCACDDDEAWHDMDLLLNDASNDKFYCWLRKNCCFFSRTCVLFEHYKEERPRDRENEKTEIVANDWFGKVAPRLKKVWIFNFSLFYRAIKIIENRSFGLALNWVYVHIIDMTANRLSNSIATVAYFVAYGSFCTSFVCVGVYNELHFHRCPLGASIWLTTGIRWCLTIWSMISLWQLKLS